MYLFADAISYNNDVLQRIEEELKMKRFLAVLFAALFTFSAAVGPEEIQYLRTCSLDESGGTCFRVFDAEGDTVKSSDECFYGL